MKKTNKILLTSVVMLSSLGLVGVLSAKDNSLGDLKFTADVAGEKVSVGKKGAHVATDMPAGEFVNGTSKRVSNAVVQKSSRNNATSLRFIAAVKANTVTKDKLEVGGELGFHVKAGDKNKNIIVDYVYNSVKASSKTYKANELSSAETDLTMANFLTDTGMENNGYNLFMVLEFTNISDALINTAFEVQPFFIPTGGTVEYSAGTKEAKATGVTATVGNKTVFMEKTDVDSADKNMQAQYKLVTDVKKGDILSFAVEGAVIAKDKIGSGNATDNNISSDLVVKNDATAATIYLKQYEKGYSVYVTGYKVDPVTTYDTYLFGTMNEWAQNEEYGLAVNSANAAERFITLDLKANDELKIVNNGTYYGYDDVKEGCINLVSNKDALGGPNILITEDGKYTFYFSTTADDKGNYIWIAKATDPVVTGTTVKIGAKEAAEMKEINPDSNIPTMTKQYAIEGVAVSEGDKLVFTVDGKVVAPGASGTDKGNLAKPENNEVVITKTAEKVDIYLKVFDNGYDVWVQEATPAKEKLPNIDGAVITENNGIYTYACAQQGGEIKYFVEYMQGDVVVASETTTNGGILTCTSNLKAGKYTVRVKAVDSTGVHSDSDPAVINDFEVKEATPDPVPVVSEVKFTFDHIEAEWVFVKYECEVDLTARNYVRVGETQVGSEFIEGSDKMMKIFFPDRSPADYKIEFFKDGKVIAQGTITIPDKMPESTKLKNVEGAVLNPVAEGYILACAPVTGADGYVVEFRKDGAVVKTQTVAHGGLVSVISDLPADTYEVYVKATDSTGAHDDSDFVKLSKDFVKGATIKIGASDAVAMMDVSADKSDKDTWEKQYKIEVAVKVGDKLVFAIDGKEITNIGPDKGENNLSGEMTVINDADATIYFKVHPDGGHSVWVTGLDTGTDPVTGATIKVGAAEAVAMKDVSDYDKLGDTWVKQYEAKVTVKAEEELVFALDGKVISDRIGPGGEKNNLKLENGKLIVINDAEATIYFKTYDDGGYSVFVTGLDTGTTPVIPDDPITETITIYYKNINNWSEVSVYYWGGKENVWPGEAMTKVDGSNNIYKFEMPVGATSCIFNNNNKGEQTGDLVIPTNGSNYYTGSSWIKYGDEEPVAQNITLYFDNSVKNWTEVSVYYWSDANGSMVAWPGKPMEKVEGSNIFKFEIPAGATYCIFNNNNKGEQTSNLDIPTNGNNCYNGTTWSTYQG